MHYKVTKKGRQWEVRVALAQCEYKEHSLPWVFLQFPTKWFLACGDVALEKCVCQCLTWNKAQPPSKTLARISKVLGISSVSRRKGRNALAQGILFSRAPARRSAFSLSVRVDGAVWMLKRSRNCLRTLLEGCPLSVAMKIRSQKQWPFTFLCFTKSLTDCWYGCCRFPTSYPQRRRQLRPPGQAEHFQRESWFDR